jgi:adenine-specific DNA-methyltransferase
MDGKSLNITDDKLVQLKAILPEAFTEGKVDLEKLRLTLGDDVSISDERYVLNWAGKSDAFRALQTPTTATLAPVEDESVDFDKTENIFIEGENLEVLKVLQRAYYGKIRMIYIDPPYNTGQDSFVYPDRFSESRDDYLKRINDKDEDGLLMREGIFRVNSKESGRYHSNWLSMMYPRIFLARNLLRDDGMIFISVDDNEFHNLRILMNEIFGEENFIDTIIWKKRYGGGAKEKYLVSLHEYILFYSKDKTQISNIFIPLDDEAIKRYYKYKDTNYERRGPYRTHPLEATKSVGRRKNLVFPIISPDGHEINPKRQWWWDKNRVMSALEKGELEFKKKADRGWTVHTKQYLREENGEIRQTKPFSIIDDVYTQHGAQEIADIFGDSRVFTFSKPSDLIYKLLDIASVKDGDLVFDFFAGSASTAHAVINRNIKEQVRTQFIMAQLPEPLEKDSLGFEKGYKTVSDIGKERLRLYVNKVKNDNPLFADNTHDLGFKVIKLKHSNFKLWRGDGIEDQEELEKQLDMLADPVRPEAIEEHMLFELLLKSGYPLTTQVEKREIRKARYYLVDGELAIALSHLNKEIIKDILDISPQQVICLDSLFANNDSLKTNTQLQFKDAGITFHSI